MALLPASYQLVHVFLLVDGVRSQAQVDVEEVALNELEKDDSVRANAPNRNRHS